MKREMRKGPKTNGGMDGRNECESGSVPTCNRILFYNMAKRGILKATLLYIFEKTRIAVIPMCLFVCVEWICGLLVQLMV